MSGKHLKYFRVSLCPYSRYCHPLLCSSNTLMQIKTLVRSWYVLAPLRHCYTFGNESWIVVYIYENEQHLVWIIVDNLMFQWECQFKLLSVFFNYMKQTVIGEGPEDIFVYCFANENIIITEFIFVFKWLITKNILPIIFQWSKHSYHSMYKFHLDGFTRSISSILCVIRLSKWWCNGADDHRRLFPGSQRKLNVLRMIENSTQSNEVSLRWSDKDLLKKNPTV